MKKSFQICLALVVLTISGCMTASGPIKTFDESKLKGNASYGIIYLPPAIELIEADGIEYETPFIESGYNEVHLLPGKHVLAFKYVKFWGDDVSGSMVRSEPILFNITIVGNERYYVNYERPKDIWNAQKIVKRFSPWMEDKQGKKIDIKGSQFFSGSLTMTNSASGSEKAVVSRDPLKELKFWWKKATYDEKKAFQQWLQKEDNED